MDEPTPRQAAQDAVHRIEALSKAGFQEQLTSTIESCVALWETFTLVSGTVYARLDQALTIQATSAETFDHLLLLKAHADFGIGFAQTAIQSLRSIRNSEGELAKLAEALAELVSQPNFKQEAFRFFEALLTEDEREQNIALIKRMWNGHESGQ